MENSKNDVEFYFSHLTNGEEKGFDYFFQLHYVSVNVYAYSLTKNVHKAEDLTEDAFVKLWQHRQSLANAGSVKAYLYSTVRNGYIDSLRKSKLRLNYLNYKIRQLSFTEPQGLENLLRAEFNGHLQRLQDNLTQNQRKVLELYYQEGKNIREIASELGLPISTVKSYKKLALDYLRDNMPPGLKRK